MAVVPSVRALYACNGYEKHRQGEVSLIKAFNFVSTEGRLPFKMRRFFAFAQLLQGLGTVSFWLELRRAEDQALLWMTHTRTLSFASRESIIHLAVAIDGVVFDRLGVYLLELYCDNNWVCDTRLEVEL